MLLDKFNKGQGASTRSPLESDEYQNMIQPILTERVKVGTDLSDELFKAKINAELQQLSKEELERAVTAKRDRPEESGIRASGRSIQIAGNG